MLNKNYIITIALMLTLTACTGSDVRGSLGLTKTAPDEFMVLSHPSLVVPPQFNLEPPRSDSTLLLQKSTAREDAKNTLFASTNSFDPAEKTEAENHFLQKAKTDEASPIIRVLLKQDNEAKALEKQEKKDSFFGGLISKITPSDDEPVIDADAERERINNGADKKAVLDIMRND